jgi:hypothetical protein
MQHGAHFRWVFPWRGRAIRDPAQVAWKQACAAIGRPGFPWHGLRHTWASWHVMAGTPLEVLQRLGGWASLAMVLRYAHLSPGYTAGYAERLSHSPTIPPQSDAGAAQGAGLVGWTMGLEPTTTGITILQGRREV